MYVRAHGAIYRYCLLCIMHAFDGAVRTQTKKRRYVQLHRFGLLGLAPTNALARPSAHRLMHDCFPCIVRHSTAHRYYTSTRQDLSCNMHEFMGTLNECASHWGVKYAGESNTTSIDFIWNSMQMAKRIIIHGESDKCRFVEISAPVEWCVCAVSRLAWSWSELVYFAT